MKSIFNALASMPELCLWSCYTCLAILLIRNLFIRGVFYALLYHGCLFCIIFIMSIGGGSVQNDARKRLELFMLLEKNNQLEQAKNNLGHYDTMFQIDLRSFKDVNAFRHHVESYDSSIDKTEAICIGWFFALLTEISKIFTVLLTWFFCHSYQRWYSFIKILCTGSCSKK